MTCSIRGARVILSDRAEMDAYQASGIWGAVALDALFFKAVRATPEKVAFLDICGLQESASTPARQMTYGEAGRAVEALAQRLLQLGLQPDDVVAVQLPNAAITYLTMLAIWRVQAIACPVSPLWREQEINAALAQVRARIVITAVHIDGHDHADMMRYVAAETFSIRHVLAFGQEVPDGVE